ncbi:MAG: pilus assembly protein, partial [Steroidobacteraceae bacterium]
NSGGSGGDGADGISFFLMDGNEDASGDVTNTNPPPYSSAWDVGAFGGSLGYSCSNVNNDSKTHPDGTTRHYDGVAGAYVGLGIDEYGNFLNGATNTLGESGTSASGDNTASGGGFQWDRIGIRGAGSINWYDLNRNYPSYYPAGLTDSQEAAAVQSTCQTGYLWNYARILQGRSPRETTTPVMDYPAIPNAYQVLTGTLNIAAEGAQTRGAATPITYSLRITENGLLSLSYSTGGSFRPVLTDQDIRTSNGALPPTFRFGFAGSTGGSTNVHEILCFQAGPGNLADTSLGVNQKEASKIAAGEQAFLASYAPDTWAGDLTANNLLFNPVTQTITVSTTANWSASCDLTGVASALQTCTDTGQAGPLAAEAPASRTMLTWNGSSGIPLEWTSLSTAEQNTIDQGDATPINDYRLLYLRGDRTNEINTSGVGLYRTRNSVLGDIIDSNPTWVGPPAAPYSLVWKDYLYPTMAAPENGPNTYPQFITNEQTRLNVVYVGANDGLLHGFRAGAYDANNNFVSNSTTPNDGEEVLAYMPGVVFQDIHNSSNANLDYSNAQYSHSYYVDATPDADDLYYANAWHSWLVGGLGAGGSALYALDVTNPTNFSEANASTLVIGEWTPSTITCTNVASCGNDLGSTYGTPVIRRLHNGGWGVIFGNGYGSATGDAGIYIMTVDPTTGAKTFYYLSTGQAGTGDGIAFPQPADLDSDNIVDYVYAGDIKGHVWRFDLTSSNPANWAVTPTPVFTEPNGNPITTRVDVAATVPAPGQGSPRLLILFGTGEKTPLTLNSQPTYSATQQYLYGIWDSNMASWNAQSSVKYASLPTPPTSIPQSSLQVQTLTEQTVNSVQDAVLDDSNNPVCWADLPNCTGTSGQYGWYIALPASQEQVIFSPIVYQGTLYVNTTIPPSNPPGICQVATETGHTIGISATTGGVV